MSADVPQPPEQASSPMATEMQADIDKAILLMQQVAYDARMDSFGSWRGIGTGYRSPIHRHIAFFTPVLAEHLVRLMEKVRHEHYPDGDYPGIEHCLRCGRGLTTWPCTEFMLVHQIAREFLMVALDESGKLRH